MKPKIFWFFLGGALIVEIIAVIFKLLSGSSWWFVGIPSIIFGLCLFGFGIFFLARLGLNKPMEEAKIKDMKKEVIEWIKRDEDNPDNYRIKQERVGSYGDVKEPTPIYITEGYGTESFEETWVGVNLNNPNKRTRINNPTPEKIAVALATLPDILSTEAVRKSMTTMDIFGKPVTTVEERTPIGREKKNENEENEEIKEPPQGKVGVQD